MHIASKLALALLVSLLSPAVAAQETAPTPEERLRAALSRVMQPIELTEGELKGPGAALLVREAGAAEFLLIGESHGNAETPQLTAALLPALRPHGYSVLALEVGPISTALLAERAASGGEPAVREVMERLPFTNGFLNWREERALLASAVEADWSVWGIDQEFLGSDRFLLERLLELAHDEKARTEARAALERAQAGFDHFMATGDQSRAFLVSTTPEQFAQLAAVFENGEAQAREIVNALEATAAVYGHYGAGRYFENNRDRVRLMKRYTAEALERVSGTGNGRPKVIFKLGSAHAGRGFSPFDQLDVGNLAAEVATMRGGESFHLYVLARGSVDASGQEQDYLAGAPYLAPLFEAMPAEGAALFDMRPLRPLLSSERYQKAFPELHELSRRFDAVLLFARFNAAEALVEMPGAGGS